MIATAVLDPAISEVGKYTITTVVVYLSFNLIWKIITLWKGTPVQSPSMNQGQDMGSSRCASHEKIERNQAANMQGLLDLRVVQQADHDSITGLIVNFGNMSEKVKDLKEYMNGRFNDLEILVKSK
jgi:hypothetical protein